MNCLNKSLIVARAKIEAETGAEVGAETGAEAGVGLQDGVGPGNREALPGKTFQQGGWWEQDPPRAILIGNLIDLGRSGFFFF